jgi:pectin methylesterase-like acyl-CoA thioesterase/predicted RecA/RadA family phage recombinase
MKNKKISLILAFTLVSQLFIGAIDVKTVKAVEQTSAMATVATSLTNSQTIIFVDGSQPADATQNRYKTITEAVAAAPTPTDESSRVIIQIADGTYREQVIVDKPYITFKSASGDPSKVVLTWYYGIGYVYNNIGTNGFYSSNVDWSAASTWAGLTAHKAGDIISKVTYYDKQGVLHTDETVKGGTLGKPDRWGCGTKLNSTAKYFIADGITFDSSFNYKVTQEEIDAGVTPETQANPKPARASLGAGSVEVEKSKYVERSASLHSDADNVIIKNSVISSKQDSLYIGSNRIFFDKCEIQGGTDYIFGGSTAVFNQCNLVFAGNSDNGNSGVTTAASHSPTTKYGYLFWNCTIDYRTATGQTPTAGTLGRPWSDPLGAQVTYYNTTVKKVNGVQLISDIGWTDMNVKMTEARFYEYGTKDESGNAVDTSKRPINSLAPMGVAIDKWQILEFNPRNYLKGNDGWDPMDFAKYYTGIDQVLSSTSIDTSGAGDTIPLPSAPAGYEFSWASDSKYAVVSDDKSTITVTRPAYGEPSISATVTLYTKDSATGFGDKKNIAFEIQPKATTENTYSVNGTVALKSAETSDVSVQILFKQLGVTIKTQNCTVPAGQTSINYTAQYLPAGNYDVVVQTPSGYKLVSDVVATISGNKGETKKIDVTIGKLFTYKVKTTDFTEPWAAATETVPATGFSMGKYIVTGSETASLGGAGNTVYKFTKDANATIPANVGAYWDLLAAVKANGNTLNNADTLQFSYDFLMESINYLPGNYSYFDLATSTTNAGAGAVDNTRLLRWGVYKGWNQFNMFGANNARVNGDKTQFNSNDNMANKWYHIVANIDLKNKTITTTLYNRDANKILNSKAFSIATPDATGSNPNYPTAADITKALYFNIYMDSNATTTNKMEYYFDNLELKYNDYDNSTVTPSTITNVAPLGDITVLQGTTVTLPTTASAIYSDGSTKSVGVKWTPSTVDTSTVGVKTLQGSVEGYTGSVTLKVNVTANVPTITSVAALSDITVLQGTTVTLPTTASAIYSDGSTKSVGVKWTPSTVDTSTVGVKTLQGSVEGYTGSISLNVNVTAQATKDFTVNSTFNIDKLQANKLLEVKTSVTNNVSLSKQVIAVVALYDKDDKMVNVSYISKNVSGGKIENLSAGFKLPTNVDNYKVKVFVWDGTSLTDTKMMPLSNVVTMQ